MYKLCSQLCYPRIFFYSFFFLMCVHEVRAFAPSFSWVFFFFFLFPPSPVCMRVTSSFKFLFYFLVCDCNPSFFVQNIGAKKIEKREEKS